MITSEHLEHARTFNPIMAVSTRKFLVDEYIRRRQDAQRCNDVYVRAATQPRMLMALIRLAEAHARLHLRETVDEVDVAESCRLMDVTTSMLSREESADGFRERNNAYADDFSLD